MTTLYGLKSYGLLAHPLVEALLRREIEVRRGCEAFAMGARRPEITVAGPPDDEGLRRLRETKNESTPLPTVTLRLRLTRHGAADVPSIAVTCSDKDLAELARWQRLHDALMARQALDASAIRASDARAIRLGEVPR